MEQQPKRKNQYAKLLLAMAGAGALVCLSEMDSTSTYTESLRDHHSATTNEKAQIPYRYVDHRRQMMANSDKQEEESATATPTAGDHANEEEEDFFHKTNVASSTNFPRKVHSGWDEAGYAIYQDRVRRQARYVRPFDNKGIESHTWEGRGDDSKFYHLIEKGLYGNFWNEATSGQWEPDTFDIFRKYVNPGETVVVDFGTWIGPTLLFHGQFSRRSFGIEADPAAFAVAEANIELNKLRSLPWANHVSVDSGCVAQPQDVGQLTMKAGSKPGHSVSGIGKHVAFEKEDAVTWQVQCYTLPDIFENYWGIQKPYKDVFIKVDIESYECKLIPSFYEWLKDETFLPKMYISIHPQIEKCSDKEYEGMLKTFKLYDHIRIDDKEELPQDADIGSLRKHKRSFTVVVHQDHHLQLEDNNTANNNNKQLQVVSTQKVESGWDESGMQLYAEALNRIARFVTPNRNFMTQQRKWPHGGEFYVVKERGLYQNFWNEATSGQWEPDTFDIFNKYVNPGLTTVVDFGTWIGPTLLYHGQFSRQSFGIEADPVAYAHVESNVELNKLRNLPWAEHVSVDSGCVARPEDVGQLTMKAGAKPGQSVSGIGNKVAFEQEDAVTWQVQCYTLPDLFENYWGIPKPYKDVFIKIDIESYECKLIPSFYEWLKDEDFLPKMYISIHPQIEKCTDEEYEGMLKTFRLYDHAMINDSDELLAKHAHIDSLKVFKNSFTVVLHQSHHMDGILHIE